MKKKVLSLALALALCLGLTVPAFAANEKTLNAHGVYFRLSDVISTENGPWEYDPTTYHLAPGATITITEGALDESDSGNAWTSFSFELSSDENWADLDNSILEFDKPYTYEELNRLAQEKLQEESASPDERFDLLRISVGFENGGTELGTIIFEHAPAGSTDPNAPAYQVSGWAAERVALAVETGLAPEGLGSDYRVNITRAQFAATAVKLYEAMSGKKAEATGESSFTDTSDPVILLAADLGFVSGVGGGKFDPNALVNREQAAVMLSSVYAKLGGEIPTVADTTFADNGDVSGWAKSAVAFMNSKEIVTGVGNNSFSPKGSASIEQALLISLKMFEELK